MIRLIALLVVLSSVMYGTTLTGTLKLPNGAGADGYLYLSLAQQGALRSDGGCGGPIQIVPTYEVRIKVISGVLQSPPAIYGNDCMLPAGIFYNVRFIDNNGNLLLSDRWIITGSSVNIGTIVSVVISGTTLSIGANSVLLGNPPASQIIEQPPGTTMLVNSLTISEEIIFPSNFQCDLSGCTFGIGVDFTGGIRLGLATNSQIVVGSGGNFYNRVVSAEPACGGVQDGWTALWNDGGTVKLTACVNNTLYQTTLQ